MPLNLPPRTRRAQPPMTPLDKSRTVRLHGYTHAAFSADGRYSYEHLDVPGTPWVITDEIEQVQVGWCGSLPKARRATYARDQQRARDAEQPPSE